MKLNIGENIKRLRKQRDLTQEELSEILGVSCQSVSRWEKGLCYPDMELIPVISSFFEISVDTLMGIDRVAEKDSVNEYLREFQIAVSQGRIYDSIDIARKGVAEHHNSYALLNKLMYALFLSGSDDADIENWRENQEKYDKEIVALGERIIKYCPDREICLEATERLAFHYCETGRKELGRRLYETLPTLSVCRETAIWWALEESEKLSHTRDLISKAYSLLSCGLYRLGHLVSDRDAIEVYKTDNEIEKLLYQGKTLPDGWSKSKINYLIAKHYINLGEYDNAIDHLTLCAEAAKEFDGRPDEMKSSSLFFGEKTVRRSDFETADSRSLCDIVRDGWLTDTEFNEIRDMKEFSQIIEMLN
ncbi:MAG: helix-turn-helix domain-containing protein [Clostridia bacterium]|nr:helix-turn-helix domain-containing protein [Clostridia bacterium]